MRGVKPSCNASVRVIEVVLKQMIAVRLVHHVYVINGALLEHLPASFVSNVPFNLTFHHAMLRPIRYFLQDVLRKMASLSTWPHQVVHPHIVSSLSEPRKGL